jgi:hypothetical protein
VGGGFVLGKNWNGNLRRKIIILAILVSAITKNPAISEPNRLSRASFLSPFRPSSRASSAPSPFGTMLFWHNNCTENSNSSNVSWASGETPLTNTMHRYRYHRKGRAGLSMLASSRMLLLPHSYEAVVKLLLDKGGLDPDSKNACPYDLHFCSTPPNPPPVAGLFSRTTWAWQMESRRKREK